MTEPLEAAADLVRRGDTGALVLALDGDHRWRRSLVGSDGEVLTGDLPIDVDTAAEIVRRMEVEETGVVDTAVGRLYVEVLAPDPRLVIFGAGPIAEALSSMAATAGFRVEVVDPREALVVPERFPEAAAVRHAWPEDALESTTLDERTYVVSLLHEARFEERLFPAVLASPARYIGALGSRRTHASRVAGLTDRGFDESSTGRIRGPIGLSIGAVTPAEIAVSIIAEMVAVRRGA